MGERDVEETQARAILSRSALGDEAALEDLYRMYASAVFAFILARVRNRELAEEIASDTWLGCWRSARAFRGTSRVLTWLLGIAKRQIFMRMRRKRLVEFPLDYSRDIPTDDANDLLDFVLAEAGVAEILVALDSLPPELAETVRLTWLHELPYSEIAELTDVPVGTVKSRVSRARRLLKEILGRQK